MKELSIEGKAKRYDQAIKVAEKYHNGTLKDVMETIFPELEESEDELHCKWILEYLYGEQFKDHFKAAIAWLEKQGEQKPYGQREECSDCEFRCGDKCIGSCVMKRGEQNPADKVEPKFKVGDWVMYCGKPYQITGLHNDTFTLTSCDGSYFFNNVKSTKEPVFHLWTIQDAKDGDVLATKAGGIFIYKELLYDKLFAYCGVDKFGVFKDCNCGNGLDWTPYLSGVTPATKEQRDTLFARMKEAGYEWDAEKKELKKIEQKSWSEEDEKIYKKVETAIDSYYAPFSRDAEEMSEWFKSLKDRLQSQPKQEWSEEDEKYTQGLIRGLAAKRDIHGHTTFSSNCIDITETICWLKSLKNRVLYPVSVEYNEEDIDNIADTFIPEPVWNALEESEGEGSNADAYDYSQMIAMFKAGVHWLKSLHPQKQERLEIEVLKCKNDQWVLKVNCNVVRGQLSDSAETIYKNFVYCSEIHPQSQWKPSEEQIKELGRIINHYEKDRGGRIIYSLYEQLKAL